MTTFNKLLRNTSLISFAKYLIIVEPLLMVWSFALSNLNIGIIALIGIYIVFKKKYILEKKISIIFLIFWLMIVSISLLSEYPSFSIKNSLLFVRYYFVITVFHYLILNDKRFVKKFFWTIFLLSSFLIFDSLIQATIGYNLFGYAASTIENGRISGMFKDELILGKFLLSLFFIIMALKIKINFKLKFFNILVPGLFLIAIITTGERSASFLYVFGLACIIVLPGIFTTKEKIAISILVLITLLSLFFLSDKFKSRMIFTTFSEIKSSENFLFSKGHERHYNLALDIFKKNKFFGIGPNNFRKECSKNLYKNNDRYRCTTHPHNFYIQILAETGMAGMLFAIFFFYKILNLVFVSILKKDSVLICISIALLINFFPLIPTGNFFGSWLLNINILPLAFLKINRT